MYLPYPLYGLYTVPIQAQNQPYQEIQAWNLWKNPTSMIQRTILEHFLCNPIWKVHTFPAV